jgi:hypothetical protein
MEEKQGSDDAYFKRSLTRKESLDEQPSKNS